MSDKDGGQAFPRPYTEGMTLRDYFAAKWLSTFRLAPGSEKMINPKMIAENSYAIADAMLAARKAE